MSEVAAGPGTKPKSYVVGPLPGGTLPDVGKLLTETFEEFGDNLGPYAMAGVGHLLVVLPVVFVAVFLVYAVVFGGMFGTMMIGGALSGIVAEMLGDELGALGMTLTMILSMVVPLVLALGLLGLIGAVMAPLHASLVRSIAKHQRGEEALTIGSAFTHATEGLVPVVLAGLAVTSLSLVLLMMCYLPALAVPVLLPFATTLVALHGRGAVDGLRAAFRHSTANLSWYVMFGLLTFAGTMVASYIPVLGAMFMAAFHVRAYRHVFGDGPEPAPSI